MAQLVFVKPERLSLKDHPNLNEKWVQQRIAEDPSLLGLGDVVVKDLERMQPRAGRLDLLLQDPETSRRYEVEIQLGATDESHIIRTIEYWDIERKRFPQYDHCAVLVAEDITSRFLNIIGLFNGSIPLIAIQMSGLRVGEQLALVFTTVFDELTRGTEEEDEAAAVTDRSYWETRGSVETVALADELLQLIHNFAPAVELKYNKFYIGLAENGQPNNFVDFRAKKQNIRIEVKLRQSEEVQHMLDAAELDVMDYDKRWGRYRIRLTKKEIVKNKEVLTKLMKMARDRTQA
jgi:predicted transport protein